MLVRSHTRFEVGEPCITEAVAKGLKRHREERERLCATIDTISDLVLVKPTHSSCGKAARSISTCRLSSAWCRGGSLKQKEER